MTTGASQCGGEPEIPVVETRDVDAVAADCFPQRPPVEGAMRELIEVLQMLDVECSCGKDAMKGTEVFTIREHDRRLGIRIEHARALGEHRWCDEIVGVERHDVFAARDRNAEIASRREA